MFLKLLILIIVGVVIVRAVKSLAGPPKRQVRSTGRPPLKADDVMVQDPECRIYIARRDAVPLTRDGKTIYFCSDACRDNYLAGTKG